MRRGPGKNHERGEEHGPDRGFEDLIVMGNIGRILIADDHDVVLEGIRGAMSQIPGIDVVGTARDGIDTVEKVKELKPDITILDISMPSMDGVEVTRRIQEIDRNCRVIIYSMYSDREYVLALFRAGVSGYVLKEQPLSELVNAVQAVLGGAVYFAGLVGKIIQKQLIESDLGRSDNVHMTEDELTKLSAREMEIFPLLADGCNAKEIAERLFISHKTVETHKYNIMEKLNATSIAELTKIAIKKNVIKL